ncbi:helix-turn-helix domain-containing protein [Lentilactobacillus buchneri]|uniref:helix-turn-helix domain-containing protein n=1 Tax=Lentilactobacillus buchneri TaxID=1581 RepID=UPI0012923A5D|nr:helix-turn-helix transcriptional regulator [Lentilactobacillus buchneri]MQM78828.1 helix-turn-helix transcriptional regulator [Lentilactobacillus buchneri]MQM88882.1 helix-turn-helix transcriptional regulator [Lentilactobacillus buchneri]MQN21031.1 helix-turn-helix transcriptional regulator [Lentilactobacillus buchneri]
MTLVDRIKKVAKEKRGWNLKTTAQNAGIGINSIYRWKEQTPTIESLNKVAIVLGVSVDYLLGKTDNPNGAKDKPTVDLNKDDAILTFDGKPIPEEDMELIKRLLGK